MDKEVLKVLKKNDGWMTSAEIANELKSEGKRLYVTLNRLHKYGEVDKKYITRRFRAWRAKC